MIKIDLNNFVFHEFVSPDLNIGFTFIKNQAKKS